MRALSKGELTLHGYSDRRIRELEAAKLKTPLAKSADLEAMYVEVKARRAEALALVKKEGLVLIQDKYSARGELYQVRIPHPALAIACGAELQLATLAKLIGAEPEPRDKTASEVMAEANEMLEEAGIRTN